MKRYPIGSFVTDKSGVVLWTLKGYRNDLEYKNTIVADVFWGVDGQVDYLYDFYSEQDKASGYILHIPKGAMIREIYG
jgi:hypothetical protein